MELKVKDHKYHEILNIGIILIILVCMFKMTILSGIAMDERTTYSIFFDDTKWLMVLVSIVSFVGFISNLVHVIKNKKMMKVSMIINLIGIIALVCCSTTLWMLGTIITRDINIIAFDAQGAMIELLIYGISVLLFVFNFGCLIRKKRFKS